MSRFVSRSVRAVTLLARDRRIPRLLRGLIVFGLMPLPGPLDEVVLAITVALLAVFCREPLRQAWVRADAASPRSP